MTTLTVEVLGTPQPQGSKSGFVNPRTGKVVMVEAVKGMKPWREKVTAALINEAARTGWVKPGKDTPIMVQVVLYFDKPKTAKRSYMTVKPDADKCLRLINDAIVLATLIPDDSQINCAVVEKVYGSPARAIIEITKGDNQ